MAGKVITVAASDPSGGAGIEADLKTVSLLGGYGMSAITALTIQNSLGIHGMLPSPLSHLRKVMDALLSDIGVDALKTGALISPGVINIICEKIKQYCIEKVVVDPVMVSKGGYRLLSPRGVESLKKRLFPLSYLVTPNIPEAEIITSARIENLKEMRSAAKKIQAMGAKNVLVKGGHFRGNPIDIFFDGKRFISFKATRIPNAHTHGAGCVYASAIATGLARGKNICDAIKEGKEFINHALVYSIPLGKGIGPVNPYGLNLAQMEKTKMKKELEKAFIILKKGRIGHLIPEVQSNLVYALPYAERENEVLGFPGRIVKMGQTIEAPSGSPVWGGSTHMARLTLGFLRSDGLTRSAMNIRYSPEIVEICGQLGLHIASFSREKEPKLIREREGGTIEWAVKKVAGKENGTPDIIYDLGALGKEPMIRVTGKDPLEVAEKVLRISHRKRLKERF